MNALPPEIEVTPSRLGLSVAEHIVAAQQALASWAATPIPQRLTAIRHLRHQIAGNALALAEAARVDRNVPLAEVLASEVLPLADACRFLEREATAALRPRRLSRAGKPSWLMGVSTEVQRKPFGIVLIIGPANYPLFLPSVQAIQAIVAGNVVLLKPGSGGGPAARAFWQLCVDVGIGPPLIQLLDESPHAAREAIEAGVDKVILTGSAGTGQEVLTQLAPRLVPATLELSGCDAAFVQADADLALTARALRFGLVWNGGATCIAPRRVFVPREKVAALEEQLLAALREVPRDSGRWKFTPTARALVQQAVDQGARRLDASFAADGPIVLTNARAEMRLLQQDVFAPVLALVPVDDAESALRLAEQCPYALGATVFGEERSARQFAERVNAGVVIVNDVIVPTADPRVPFGGRGRSGYGVTRGTEGLLELTRLKVIAVRSGRCRWHLDEADFSDHDLVRHYLVAVHGATLRDRWNASRALLNSLIHKAWNGHTKKDRGP
jgi:acyl-CoA reductase-like NAD-dependent aldehyde dehydrogenase